MKPAKTDLISKLAPMKGVEPPTCRLGGDRSILLSYMGLYYLIVFHYILWFSELYSSVFRLARLAK